MRLRAGWLGVWGKQHLGVQRACLICSLALAAPPGKAADDKLSGEVSCSCSISLPQALTLFVDFTVASCPRQPGTLPVTPSTHWPSLPVLIQPLFSFSLIRILFNMNNRYIIWTAVIHYPKIFVLYYCHMNNMLEEFFWCVVDLLFLIGYNSSQNTGTFPLYNFMRCILMI